MPAYLMNTWLQDAIQDSVDLLTETIEDCECRMLSTSSMKFNRGAWVERIGKILEQQEGSWGYLIMMLGYMYQVILETQQTAVRTSND